MEWANIPRADYEKFATQFNPVKFDAREWVGIAKDAGMKYIVITSKHHDGFALYNSKVSNYDIVDATPYKRDRIKELAAEAATRPRFLFTIQPRLHYPAAYTDAPDKDPTAGNRTTKLKPGGKEEYLKYERTTARADHELQSVCFGSTANGRIGNEEDGQELYVRSWSQARHHINNRVGRGRQGMQE
jgi:alpha-L-fucosidase